MTLEELDRAVSRLLEEEALKGRPDRRGPRGNGETDAEDVKAGVAKWRRVLG